MLKVVLMSNHIPGIKPALNLQSDHSIYNPISVVKSENAIYTHFPTRFLKTTGIILGGVAVVGTRLTFLETPQATPNYPENTEGENSISKRSLVAYASQGGSMAGDADENGKTPSNAGGQVDIRRLNLITDLSPYQAVILGSAIHSGKWFPEATRFVETNQSTLCKVPTVIFQVCMMLANENETSRATVPGWLEQLAMLG